MSSICEFPFFKKHLNDYSVTCYPVLQRSAYQKYQQKKQQLEIEQKLKEEAKLKEIEEKERLNKPQENMNINSKKKNSFLEIVTNEEENMEVTIVELEIEENKNKQEKLEKLRKVAKKLSIYVIKLISEQMGDKSKNSNDDEEQVIEDEDENEFESELEDETIIRESTLEKDLNNNDISNEKESDQKVDGRKTLSVTLFDNGELSSSNDIENEELEKEISKIINKSKLSKRLNIKIEVKIANSQTNGGIEDIINDFLFKLTNFKKQKEDLIRLQQIYDSTFNPETNLFERKSKKIKKKDEYNYNYIKNVRENEEDEEEDDDTILY
jgi:hypothetical protein